MEDPGFKPRDLLAPVHAVGHAVINAVGAVGKALDAAVTHGIEDLLKLSAQEERIYRLRCVEAWSMVIPWTGFTLSSLLKEVEPTSDAKYVRFETVHRPEEMPGQKSPFYPWPYQEGLRLDEAMNELAILFRETNDGATKISFRSNGEVDVNALARQFGDWNSLASLVAPLTFGALVIVAVFGPLGVRRYRSMSR